MDNDYFINRYKDKPMDYILEYEEDNFDHIYIWNSNGEYVEIPKGFRMDDSYKAIELIVKEKEINLDSDFYDEEYQKSLGIYVEPKESKLERLLIIKVEQEVNEDKYRIEFKEVRNLAEDIIDNKTNLNNHYKIGDHETIDVVKYYFAGVTCFDVEEIISIFNVLKYTRRCNSKGQRTKDIIKAIEYLLMMLNLDTEEREEFILPLKEHVE